MKLLDRDLTLDRVRRALKRRDASGNARISIVIPARDAASTIERTIRSVLDQTSDRWEAIVVDDGSADDTVEVVRSIAGHHAEVRIVTGQGSGVSAARNLGTDAARHDYVLYLDADDWIDDRFVELMTDDLDAHPELAGVRCVWAYVTPDGRSQPWDDLDLSNLFAVAATRCPFAVHAAVVKRQLVVDAGGFDTHLVIGEDWDLWQRIARTGAALSFVDEVLAFYLMRPKSVMHQDMERMQSDLVIVHERGHGPDERVKNPLPEFADGLAPVPGFEAKLHYLPGTMGVAIPTEIDLATLIPTSQPHAGAEMDADEIAGSLMESVPFGSCALLSDWPHLYVQHEARINEMLELFATWAGNPDLAARTRRVLENQIASTCDVSDVEQLGRTAIRTLDLARGVHDIRVEDPADQLVARVIDGTIPIGVVSVPVIDGVASEADLVVAVSTKLGPKIASQSTRSASLARRLVSGRVGKSVVRAGVHLVLDTPWQRGAGRRDTVDRFLRWSARNAAVESIGHASVESTGSVHGETENGEPADPPHAENSAGEVEDGYGPEYFAEIFDEPDPWMYSGNYEQTKYEQSLAVLGDRRFARGLELACAEGHFTVQLAPRVDELIAADIAPLALDRAAERCAAFPDIDFRQIDLRHDELPGDLDLLVCSEVLYFVESDELLGDVARRFAASLAPGGVLLMAHANLVSDDPKLTGFDWGHNFGARRIGEIVAEEPGLRHITTHVSELYRIHLFEKTGSESVASTPTEVPIPFADDLDPHIARMALWGGTVVTRDHAAAHEVTDRLPILTYHRIASTGNAALADYRVTPDRFEQQLDYLRAHGYYGITAEQWRWAMASSQPLRGRAVMITFDDGYRDFLDDAWPLLRDYEFPATVFVVTDLVGGTATWDTRFGEPAPLMNWDELRMLERNGIEIGSHTAGHDALKAKSPADTLVDEARARETLHRELSRDVTSVAYPYGVHDGLSDVTMYRAGYRSGYTTAGEASTVWDDPMSIPRIDVGGHDSLEVFAHNLGVANTINPMRRGLTSVRNRSR